MEIFNTSRERRIASIAVEIESLKKAFQNSGNLVLSEITKIADRLIAAYKELKKARDNLL